VGGDLRLVIPLLWLLIILIVCIIIRLISGHKS
jgi:hypothetical protein